MNELAFSDQALATCVNQLAQDLGLEYDEQINQLDCSNRGITALNGIEDTPSLTRLDIANNELRSLNPVLGLTQLDY